MRGGVACAGSPLPRRGVVMTGPPLLLLCGGVEQIQSPKGTHAGRRFLYNTRWLVTMYIGWTASEVTPGVMVSMCVRSVGICVYRYNVHEMGGVWREGGGREGCLEGERERGSLEGGRENWTSGK